MGDMDGDGDLDIVEGNSGTYSRVYLNPGNGYFDTSNTIGNADEALGGLALGDVNNDGGLDVMIVGNNGYNVDYWSVCPDINILGNSVSIASGDTSPAASDHTDFGSTSIAGGTVVRTFTIQNTGSAALSLTGSSPYVTLSGDTTEFAVSSIPSALIAAAGSTAFNITFDPTASGLKSATVSIASNDGDENPYTFAIQGTGLSAPEINVLGNTDFGSVTVASGTVESTFTIQNTGSAALSLTGSSPYVTLTGHTTDFSVTSIPASSIGVGESTSFKITFDPTTTESEAQRYPSPIMTATRTLIHWPFRGPVQPRRSIFQAIRLPSLMEMVPRVRMTIPILAVRMLAMDQLSALLPLKIPARVI
jgi:archaellum component FlaG (FlaF/FlaG flagellin family)